MQGTELGHVCLHKTALNLQIRVGGGGKRIKMHQVSDSMLFYGKDDEVCYEQQQTTARVWKGLKHYLSSKLEPATKTSTTKGWKTFF